MPIQALIDKQDYSEIIRDQIAAILLSETTSQVALATAAVSPTKNANLWRLRIYTERSNPWADFLDCPDEAKDSALGAPIVNVSFDSATYDMSGSNVVDRQKTVGVFHVDCYGYGVSAASGSGHVAGDARASIECQRAVRLVRNILMAGMHTYLGMRGVVWRRWPQSVTIFQPQVEGRAVQQIVAARLALQVDFNEFSPQSTYENLELISATINRYETGQIYFTAQYE